MMGLLTKYERDIAEMLKKGEDPFTGIRTMAERRSTGGALTRLADKGFAKRVQTRDAKARWELTEEGLKALEVKL